MASTIGIKLANGEFYPVLEENSQEKKRLVLTTVHDDQRSIQIDLYRSSSKTMTDALYIGSLVMEKIRSQPKGQPSIEMVVASSESGDITADAVDLDVGTEGRQTLSVSLKSLDEVKQDFVISDADLQDDMVPPTGLYEPPAGEIKKEKKWLPKVIIIVLILLLLLLAIWFLFFRDGGIIPCIQQLFQGPQASEQSQTAAVSQQTPSQVAIPSAAPAAQAPAQSAAPVAQAPAQSAAPAVQAPAQSAAPAAQTPAQPAQTTPSPPVAASSPAQTPQPPPVTASSPAQTSPPPQTVEAPAVPASPPVIIQAPAEPPAVVQVNRTRPVPPVASYNVPSVIPRGGVLYRIRYGDTLWDISEAFYRNPWLYPQIARFNNIRNPDRIISGTTIRVPPRN